MRYSPGHESSSLFALYSGNIHTHSHQLVSQRREVQKGERERETEREGERVGQKQKFVGNKYFPLLVRGRL